MGPLEANRQVFGLFKLMIAFRKSHACIGRPIFWREDVLWHGPDGPVVLGMNRVASPTGFAVHRSAMTICT